MKKKKYPAIKEVITVVPANPRNPLIDAINDSIKLSQNRPDSNIELLWEGIRVLIHTYAPADFFLEIFNQKKNKLQ